jgi:hypothetical protein
MHWLVPSLNRCVPDGNLYLPCLLQAREDRLLSLVLVAQRAEFFAIEHPLFTPLCSGPKTASKPSRRKQFPSCYKGPNLWIMIRDAGNRIRHAIFFCYNSKPLIPRDDELWLLTPIHFDARLIDRATPVTGPYTVGRFTFRQRCGGCGGYFRSSTAARVWCVYINSKRSKKTAPADKDDQL